MRGYVGQAKSARAVEAEGDGDFPASVLARRYHSAGLLCIVSYTRRAGA